MINDDKVGNTMLDMAMKYTKGDSECSWYIFLNSYKNRSVTLWTLLFYKRGIWKIRSTAS